MMNSRAATSSTASHTSGSSSRNTSSEALTSEMINNLTMTQLLYILQRIQQLCFHSPEHARELLADSPQLALALIHAQYIVSGKEIDSSLLPLTGPELKAVKDRMELIKSAESMSGNQPPITQESLIGMGSTDDRIVQHDVGLSKKFSQQIQQPNDQFSELTKLLMDLDPTILATVMESVIGATNEVVDVKSLVEALMNLSAEQIAALPESIQRQVLKLLEDSMTTQ